MTTIRAISRVVPDVVVDGGCVDEAVYGSNIALDPGVETQLATTGGGPGGNEIPTYDDSSPTDAAFSDGSEVDVFGYWSAPTAGGAHPFIVSTANPRNGTYHLRRDSTDAFLSATFSIGRDRMCVLAGGLLTNFGGWYSAVMAVGDSVTFTFWHATSAGATLASYAHWYDADGASLSTDSDSHSSTASYAEATLSATAPASTKFVVLQVEGHSERVSDYDDFSVVVTAA